MMRGILTKLSVGDITPLLGSEVEGELLFLPEVGSPIVIRNEDLPGRGVYTTQVQAISRDQTLPNGMRSYILRTENSIYELLVGEVADA
jgi:hypothetical protein